MNKMISLLKTVRSLTQFRYQYFNQQQPFKLKDVLATHKSQVGLEDEIKKYENNKKLERMRLERKDIVVDKDQLEVHFTRSSGPGGQHVNKTSSKADIRFKIETANWIKDEVKIELRKRYPHHVTHDDYFYLVSSRTRCANTNLRDGIERLRDILFECSQPQKERLNLIPAETKDLQAKRIDVKRLKGSIKSTRSIR